MNRKVLAVTLTITLFLIVISPLASVSAANVPVTQLNGKLGDANYILQFPDNWHGDLVLVCRGYSHLMSGVDIQTNADRSAWLTNKGYAIAVTDYGAAGFCIKEAMIRVHQLTEYVIDNYDVSGNVFLVGMSMGGVVAMELGAKYPNLYDGVIHMSSPLDVTYSYEAKLRYAAITNDADLTATILADGGVAPPYPFPSIKVFRNFCGFVAADTEIECGGTPDTKPKAYERISPIDSATNIAIPTITVHGTADAVAHYGQALGFYNTVVAQGHDDLYRFYKVIGGEHCNPPVDAQMKLRFDDLVKWVDEGIPAPASIT